MNLTTLRLQVRWLPTQGLITRRGLFNAHHAKDMMLRYERSVLRVIEIGSILYTVSIIYLADRDDMRILLSRESGSFATDSWYLKSLRTLLKISGVPERRVLYFME